MSTAPHRIPMKDVMPQISLQSLIDLFNAGRYAACYDACVARMTGGDDAPTVVFLAGYSAYKLGDFMTAEKLVAALDETADNGVASLAQSVRESSSATSQLPRRFFDATWLREKRILRIGGRVRLLDFYLEKAAQVTDFNAASETHGKDNHADIIGDAHRLPGIDASSYDVIVSSHTIEHLVNPMLALRTWRNALRGGGYIYSVVPNYVHTFDHLRTPTTLAHLVDELNSGDTAINWFHVVEFLRHHDVDKDLVYKGDRKKHFEDFIQAPHLHTHYHVFDLPLVYAMHEYCGYKTVACFESEISIHYVGINASATD